MSPAPRRSLVERRRGWQQRRRRSVVTTNAGSRVVPHEETPAADDLLRFARALLDGKLVKPKTLDALLAPRARFLGASSYGYGFIVQKGRDGARSFGHEGGIVSRISTP